MSVESSPRSPTWPWIGLGLLALWTARPHPLWLAAAALCWVLSGLYIPTRRPFRWALGLVIGLVAVPVGFWSHHSVSRIQNDWSSYWAVREAGVFDEANRRLDDLVERGDATVEALAALSDSANGRPTAADLAELRRQSGLSALAIYTAAELEPLGEPRPLVWDGAPRGRIPSAVRSGDAPYVFGGPPLFRYLYFTRELASGGGTAVAIVLMDSHLPETVRANRTDVAHRISRRSGEHVRITVGATGEGEVVADFTVGADTLFSVVVDLPVPADRAWEVETRRVRLVTLLILLAWLFLAVGGYGRRDHGARWAALLLLFLAAVLPLDRLVPGAALLDRASLLPGGVVVLTLGRVMAIALALVAVSVLLKRDSYVELPSWARGLLVAVAYPVILAVVLAVGEAGVAGGGEGTWVAFQLAATVLLTLACASSFGLTPRVPPVGVPAHGEGEGPAAGSGRLLPWGKDAVIPAIGATLFVALAAGQWVSSRATFPVGMAVVWVIPTLLAGRVVAPLRGWRRVTVIWSASAVIATSLALPSTWWARVDDRLSEGETRLQRLGARVDPELEDLMVRLGEEAQRLDREGHEPLEVMFEAWIESGFAGADYPVFLTLWFGELPEAELRIKVREARPALVARLVEQARGGADIDLTRLARTDVHYVATVPLSDDVVISAVVPPVPAGPSTATSLGPFSGLLAAQGVPPVTLVPLRQGDEAAEPGVVVWTRDPGGWQGVSLVEFPGVGFNAIYRVHLADRLVTVARGTLLLMLNVLVVLAAWSFGRLIFLRARPAGEGLRVLVASFRARVTVALFGFFLLSNAIFGTLAYRTISGASVRTAQVLAERVGADAAGLYLDVQGGMELLARRVGSDLLEYRAGALREGSPEELVELGLYEGWLPLDVFELLARGEGLLTTRATGLGVWEYVTAYRRLPDGDILGVPVPVQLGAAAVRSREIVHLLAFAVVAGGLLSLLLALWVGRTLTQPIRTLQTASERVGGGNLGVRLPDRRPDEFGAVFSAFNRMVRRIRRARRALVRTTQRTQAIVEDAATGVIALDPAERVTLVNRRAAELLGVQIDVGMPLAETGGAADELVRWVRRYFRDGLREVSGEFQFGMRRMRVRARRIRREGPLGGAVLSIEDVTDELRTERVLAWGEMARQVAHEVKNPLTPIKLSIQHIRRAWEDRSGDFELILDRNAEAALNEIDRLATIASSFSRFGAPEMTGESPLRPVDLELVVSEVLALYDSGDAPSHFRQAIPPGLPLVSAREVELKEVLINLLENSRAAIAEEGEVIIEAEPTAGGVAVRVRDDGVGIPAHLHAMVFEPHFSTRSAGTGLGLAIVKRLVESWDGSVGIASMVGEGTVVELSLAAFEAEGEGSGDVG